jgi:hypothetical protein
VLRHGENGIDLVRDAWGRVGRWRLAKQPWRRVVSGPEEQGTRWN